MGFELLPIEDSDEDIYDVITITNPLQWTPRKFKDEPFDGYFYDPTDETVEAQGYPAVVNHLSQLKPSQDIDSDDIVENYAYGPMIETQVYATKLWHRVCHQELDAMYLRPFFGWRPPNVIKQ